VIFVPKYVSRVVFKGGILGSTCQFWGNPYLNSMTYCLILESEHTDTCTYNLMIH